MLHCLCEQNEISTVGKHGLARSGAFFDESMQKKRNHNKSGPLRGSLNAHVTGHLLEVLAETSVSPFELSNEPSRFFHCDLIDSEQSFHS